MDYTKFILQREGISLGKSQTFVDIYEMMSNQQDIQKVGKKILQTLKLKGEVSLIRYQDNRFYLVEHLGKAELVHSALDDKSILREVRISKNLYQDQSDTLAKPYYMVLPILSKNDEFLGALCIHEKQEVKCWKDIHVLLNLMSVVFKYYGMIDSNKFFNVKDTVTSLYNFKHFQNHLDIEIEKATRYHIALSLVIVDIENFQMINDKLGYDGGDEVLHQVGEWIGATARKVDMPARLEGDSFAILLSNTPKEGAHVFLERLLTKIKNNQIQVKNHSFKIRVHTSVTTFDPKQTRQEFLNNALDNLKRMDQ